jgi:ABC-type polysaccharide/polyol phosphate transport system ATPase subunit
MSSIKLDNVSLDYVIKTGSDSIKKTMICLFQNLFKKSTTPEISLKNTSYRALSNINLALEKGDRIGLLGRNGAGKSTLLRVLANIYKPNFGTVTIKGKVYSLFDVSLGMNFEATGYENIVNLTIIKGLSKKIALSIINDVEEFTELGEFLNHPVRTYSAGMLMKLAFAVATSFSPEIILIDEIIGVGDIHFMEKAAKRLESIISQCHILALTSHSNDIIRRFCNKAVVLKNGEVQFMGSVEESISFYEAMS